MHSPPSSVCTCVLLFCNDTRALVDTVRFCYETRLSFHTSHQIIWYQYGWYFEDVSLLSWVFLPSVLCLAALPSTWDFFLRCRFQRWKRYIFKAKTHHSIFSTDPWPCPGLWLCPSKCTNRERRVEWRCILLRQKLRERTVILRSEEMFYSSNFGKMCLVIEAICHSPLLPTHPQHRKPEHILICFSALNRMFLTPYVLVLLRW